MPTTPDEILNYWFGGLDPDVPAVAEQQKALWWGHDEATDLEVKQRFGDIHEAACRGEFSAWAEDPTSRVALVIVFDQISRNIHRGTRRAFTQDPAARQLSLAAIDGGEDRSLPFFHRVFLYMPLEHTENITHQERCCELFAALREQAPAPLHEIADNYVGFAHRHRDIIAKFGRFPHRNSILARVSTTEEIEFLKEPGSSF